MKKSPDSIRIVLLLTAVTLLVVSCFVDLTGPVPETRTPWGLSIVPKVFRGGSNEVSGRTKALSDDDPNIKKGDEVIARDDERENFFRTLDVFVKESTASETSGWFKTYHLVAGENAPSGQGPWQLDTEKYLNGSTPTGLLDEARNLLANNWSAEGYDPTKTYDIYAAANNPHTSAGSAPATLAQLKALTTTREDIVRYSVDQEYDPAHVLYRTNYMFKDSDDRQKEFMMDGKIEGWSIDPNAVEQVFEVPLSRAAAKILINMSFDGQNETIPKSHDSNDDHYWDDKPAGDGSTLVTMKDYLTYVHRTVGVPRWKYVNFCDKGADVADGSFLPAKSDLITFSGNFNTFIYDQNGVFIDDPDMLQGDNVDNSFTLVTYTFPVDWSEGNAAGNTNIPYILLSFGYTRTTGTGADEQVDTKISYYRIPVCDERTVTKLERNNIYIVDVKIASMGSSNENLELEDQELRIEYHVLPWEGITIDQQISSVIVSPTKYLTVTPKEYTLKGDDTQGVDLQWYASVSTDDNQFVDIDVSDLSISYVNYLGNTVDIKGTTTKTQNPDGTTDIEITSTAPTTTANGETVKITITPGGLIKVSSDALASRAVKTISFDVQLRNTALAKEHIVIKHFPLDNIQSIAGSWSSLNKANWVDWERDNGKEYNSANAKYTRDADGHFYAKVYDPDEEKIYAIAVTRSGNNNNRRYKYGRATSQSANTGNYYYNEDRDYGQIKSNMTSLTNNHMYVIQLTSTSDEYAVGKPTVVNNLSDDQVVSPAFMIASQLGANTPFNNDINGAANLCGSYMEVGTDGTRYTGWRLPTRDEVGFIVKYQNDPEVENRNMQKVMTGTHYWTLEGKAVATGAYVVNNTTYWYNDYATRYKDTQYDATSGNVRCLRDLTLEELNKLNGTTTN